MLQSALDDLKRMNKRQVRNNCICKNDTYGCSSGSIKPVTFQFRNFDIFLSKKLY